MFHLGTSPEADARVPGCAVVDLHLFQGKAAGEISAQAELGDAALCLEAKESRGEFGKGEVAFQVGLHPHETCRVGFGGEAVGEVGRNGEHARVALVHHPFEDVVRGVEVVARLEKQGGRFDQGPVRLGGDDLVVERQSVALLHATFAARKAPEIFVEMAGAADRRRGGFHAWVDGREHGASPAHGMAFHPEAFAVHLRTCFEKGEGASTAHGDEVPTAVEQVRFLVQRMGAGGDEVPVELLRLLGGSGTFEAGREPVPIGVWCVRFLERFSAPVHAYAGEA